MTAPGKRRSEIEQKYDLINKYGLGTQLLLSFAAALRSAERPAKNGSAGTRRWDFRDCEKGQKWLKRTLIDFHENGGEGSAN